MIRVILKAPASIQIGSLTTDQQQAINDVFARYVMPMPGTKESAGYKLIDAIVNDSFNPENIAILGLPFEILGQWLWDGESSSLYEAHTISDSFIDFLPDNITYDLETGEQSSSIAPSMHEPHKWAGWPEITF